MISSKSSATTACRKPHPLPWEGARGFTKVGFFDLQAELWAFHTPEGALSLRSGVGCLRPVPVHVSCSPRRWLLTVNCCVRSSAVSQKTPRGYFNTHFFSFWGIAWLLCWAGRKAGANRRQFEFSSPLGRVYKGIVSKKSSKTKMLSQYCNTYNVYLNHILEISAKSILDTPVPNKIG